MGQIDLTTPALLFPAISLLLLAYTNRFLHLAQLVRNLHAAYHQEPDALIIGQIANLRRRIVLIRNMQVLGVLSLFLCVAAMLFNRSQWYSFFRISQGWMPISGRGDVDGDDVYTNSSDPTLNTQSDEREPAGFRFYLGIGSRW